MPGPLVPADIAAHVGECACNQELVVHPDDFLSIRNSNHIILRASGVKKNGTVLELPLACGGIVVLRKSPRVPRGEIWTEDKLFARETVLQSLNVPALEKAINAKPVHATVVFTYPAEPCTRIDRLEDLNFVGFEMALGAERVELRRTDGTVKVLKDRTR